MLVRRVISYYLPAQPPSWGATLLFMFCIPFYLCTCSFGNVASAQPATMHGWQGLSDTDTRILAWAFVSTQLKRSSRATMLPLNLCPGFHEMTSCRGAGSSSCMKPGVTTFLRTWLTTPSTPQLPLNTPRNPRIHRNKIQWKSDITVLKGLENFGC